MNDLERSEKLFNEFLDKLRFGEQVSPEDYFEKYPDLKMHLQRLFESLKDKSIEQNDTIENQELPYQEIGDFRLLRKIGSGGMGTVYEADQISLKRKVALKLLPKHLSFSDQEVQKFHREAEAGGRQRHPSIIAVYAVGEQEGQHFIAQELVEDGISIFDKLEEARVHHEPALGYFREAAKLILEISDALHHAHESGVIHRDIKPSNILLTSEGTPKVSDFGLAKVEDALSLSRSGELVGTPYYMSPEQAMSRRIGIDRRTDIYSLGVTFFEMLTMKRPFEGETSQEVLKQIIFMDPSEPHKSNPRVPRDLSIICMKAMEKNPAKRYQTMKEFGDDLGRFLQGEMIHAKPAGLTTRTWKQIRRHPVTSTTAGAVILFILTFATVVPWIIAWKENEKRETVEILNKEIEQERDKANNRYIEMTRLTDLKTLLDLEEESKTLWPAMPVNISKFESWIQRAEDLLTRYDRHRNTLEILIKAAIKNNHETDTLKTLSELVGGLEALADQKYGLILDIKERLEFAKTVFKNSIDDHKYNWKKTIEAIADIKKCPQYNGLLIKEHIGLVPIGQDPHSKLYEFAHLQTGCIPERDLDGQILHTEEMSIILVLLPGGTFQMGSVKPSEESKIYSQNVDPNSEEDENPVHKVNVKPFFLSKYEMTQGQWQRITHNNPSLYKAGKNAGGNKITLLNPVEQVSWNDCDSVLSRMILRFPTEAEWEYSGRAGTDSVWWSGNELESLKGAVNLADHYCKINVGKEHWEYEEWLDDGHAVHAPINTYKANPFGFHDICGNVWEFCQDFYSTSKSTPDDSMLRVMRGGCWWDTAVFCRSANRADVSQDASAASAGIRPAASIVE